MRSESARVHGHPTRTTAPALHLPFRRLALCLDCEACFEIGAPSCSACGGDTWVPLAKFLDQRSRWTEGPKRRDGTHPRVAKQVLVVARDRQKLYEYARRAFADNPTVEVVLDRRRGERRTADRPGTPERRRGDRRLTAIDDHLRALGWAVVRLDVFRTLRLPHLSIPR
jgi:hypothetical protein